MLNSLFSLSAAARRICTVSLLVAALLGFGLSSTALATPTTFTLTQANGDLATQGPGPYATITIDGSGTAWTVTGQGLNGFVFGDGGIVALNFATAAGTVDLIESSCSFGSCSDDGPGNNDGFGNFTMHIVGANGFSTGGFSTVSFNFTTSNSISSAASLFTANSNGSTASAHLALGTNTGCTGFAADAGSGGGVSVPPNTACTTTPEPNSLTTLAFSLVDLLFVLGSRRLGMSL